MGLEETVINYRSREAVAKAREEALEQGLEKGKLLERAKVTALLDYTNVMKTFTKFSDWSIAQIAAFFEIKAAKVEQLKAILAYPSTEKMQKEILNLFFKNIELSKADLEKIFDLAAAYRKQIAQN